MATPRDNRRSIVRWQAGAPPQRADDELAGEEPLEVRVRGQAISVTMRTPGHDEELAAGFLLTEGVIGSRADLIGIEPCGRGAFGNVVNAFLAPHVELDLTRLTRHVFAASSCGMCGKASIDAVRQQFPPIDPDDDLCVAAEVLYSLPDKLRQSQATFDRTGGLHGAAIFDAAGNLIVAREDVGRHNAVDKVLGHGLMRGISFARHVLMVSGRTSFEILQKALAARVPIIAAVSAPSTLAVDFAAENRQTLIGFLRGGRMNVYAGGERIA